MAGLISPMITVLLLLITRKMVSLLLNFVLSLSIFCDFFEEIKSVMESESVTGIYCKMLCCLALFNKFFLLLFHIEWGYICHSNLSYYTQSNYSLLKNQFTSRLYCKIHKKKTYSANNKKLYLSEEEPDMALDDNVNIAGFIPKNNDNNGASSLSLSSFQGFSVCLLAAIFVVRNL